MTTSRLELANALRVDIAFLEACARDIQAGTVLSQFTRRKKDGSERKVTVAADHVREPIRKLHEYLDSIAGPFHDSVYGFVKNRSIAQNASQHLAQPAVLRIDLQGFFGSITSSRVLEAFDHLGFDSDAAQLAVDLTTYEGVLPTGFSTSPILSNLAFASTDELLQDYATERVLTYSRYADDLVFSGRPDEGTISDVTAIVETAGWDVNAAKTRLMRQGGKQYVTGLSVSDPLRPRIPPGVKRRMRWKLHVIEKHGYETYMFRFGGEELNDHPRRLIGMARHIAGVEPAVGGLLLRRLTLALPDNWRFDRDDDDWMEYLHQFGF